MLAVPLVSAEDLPKHLDPDQMMEESIFPSELYLLYQTVFSSVTSENYYVAENSIMLALETYTPSETVYVLNRFNELLGEEIMELNLTKIHNP